MKKSLFFIVIVAFCALNCSISSAQNYDELITRSFDYLDADSLPEAEEALREALRIEPGNPGNGMLLLNLGTIQRRQGKLKEAEESYTIGLAFLPNNLSLLNSRAQLFAEMEKYPEAINDYTEVIYHEPENENAYYERALCKLMNQDTLGARLDLEQIDRFNPNSAKSRLGMAYVYKVQQMWREASELYDALIERNPRNASLLRERAEVFYFSNRMGAALDDVNKSIDYDPRDPYSYLLRAQIRYAKGDREFARRDLNQALELGLNKEEVRDLIEKLK
ncbi:MAG: tetratricopeptide repeat protein [Bacteroidales bacterium]|nr:tetratricopeptide repeat protein [Bacteroidales bacterium]